MRTLAALLAVESVLGAEAGSVLGAYFANWAQYHKAPYKHTASDLQGLVGTVDHIYYSFAYFCPPAGTSPMPYWGKSPYGSCSDSNEYSLMTLEHNDPASINTIKGMGFKTIASIGGWNFPSHYFSQMVSSKENRAKFISSAKTFMSQHGFAGIDIDWEYPCSPARENPVKITCDKFRTVHDAGGSCPQDKDGLVSLLKEMREEFGAETYISVASQAAQKNWEAMGIAEGTPYVDHWHVMNYDYAVPDIEDGALMSPNQPLYTPKAPALQMSVNYTISGYLAAGVPPSKIMVGMAMYGHTWYKTGLDNWQIFGQKGDVQGKCCGPFKNTYGAAPGKACSQCGVMMYSEIQAALGDGNGCTTFHDADTASDIAYCASEGSDSYTAAGTWITYQGIDANNALVDYVKSLGLAGVFTFDTSMDTLSPKYQAHKAIGARLSGPTPAPSPVPPTPSPVPSGKYRCSSNQCVPSTDSGVDLGTCNAICGDGTYKCKNNQCVASTGGVSKDVCSAICSAFVL